MIMCPGMVCRGAVLRFLVIVLALLTMAFAGCSGDSPTDPVNDNQQLESGVIRGNVDPGDVTFEYVSATNGDPDNPIEGPFAIRGRNIRYEGGALVVDLSVANLGEISYPEPVSLTFLSLLPDGITVQNPDNDESGAGASILFEFENDDAIWAPGEESLGRSTGFVVAEATAIAFVAQLNAGMGDNGLGSIGGMVWDDANGDGMMDADESGLGGVTIELDAEGMDTMSTVSGEDGSYRFDGLDVGFYTVGKVVEDGVVATTPSTIYVTLIEFDDTVASFLAANFGCRSDDGGGENGSIMGTVFSDTNQNGTRDPGEAGLVGLVVGLTGSGGEVQVMMTDKAGEFWFEKLLPGSYVVSGPTVEGWANTSPTELQVMIAAGEDAMGADFGLYKDGGEGTGMVVGAVYDDANQNGKRDEGEMGLEGLSVGLIGAGDVRQDATTDANGKYVFLEMRPAAYKVLAPVVEGWISTTPDVVEVMVVADETSGADFGLFMKDGGGGKSASISGCVYDDLNGNKQRDPGEPGIPGVKVTLCGQDPPAAVAGGPGRNRGCISAESGEDGVYLFDNVEPGSYMVAADAPEGYAHSSPGELELKVEAADEVDDADFGFQQI